MKKFIVLLALLLFAITPMYSILQAQDNITGINETVRTNNESPLTSDDTIRYNQSIYDNESLLMLILAGIMIIIAFIALSVTSILSKSGQVQMIGQGASIKNDMGVISPKRKVKTMTLAKDRHRDTA